MSESGVRPNVLITGASGLIGSALGEFLPQEGYLPIPLARKKGDTAPDGAWWDPPSGDVKLDAALPLRSVIHLAGAGIADGLWTKARKKILWESRVDATRGLAEALAALPEESRPASMICASGIGYYGHRGQEVLNEDSSKGEGYLADLAAAWEEAAEPARAAGIRVVSLRFGLVLSADGGPLKAMLRPFRLGLGGPLGNGRQMVSWITLHDALRVILTLIEREDVSGVVNGVAPGAVTQGEFAKALGKELGRPAFLPAPGFALKLILGEMAQELLLGGQRVEPTRLYAIRFPFRYPDLASAFPALEL